MRLLTYNIRKGLGASGKDETARMIGLELHKLELDLALCQEVFHPFQNDVEGQSRLIAEVTGLIAHYGANKHRTVGHHGNATFSRHPTAHVENFDVSTNGFERRGVLFVRVETLQGPLNVLNVHLGLNQLQRLKQIRRIKAIMEQLTANHEPLVLAGDFNDWTGRIEREVTESLGLRPAFSDRSAVKTWPAARPWLNLDRVYTRGVEIASASRLHGQPWDRLSDHLPLLVELRLAS